RDPRADVLSRVARELSGVVLHDRRLFDLARDVERTILRVLEEAKPGRGLRTNVEFYTAVLLHSLGLEASAFSAVFACGRCAGWCAHVMEQHADNRLIRPLSEYIGPLASTASS
ncbi:MAG TPA: citrate/2-methylcitrate synthase, partial [Vicinamibacterales bacterium]|nr:citrate/2-methylcitrate synthase [Vicinamibacterales bacterium]